MGWGTVETEPEVTAWLDSLTDDDFGQAERYIDLLAEQGVHLTDDHYQLERHQGSASRQR